MKARTESVDRTTYMSLKESLCRERCDTVLLFPFVGEYSGIQYRDVPAYLRLCRLALS